MDGNRIFGRRHHIVSSIMSNSHHREKQNTRDEVLAKTIQMIRNDRQNADAKFLIEKFAQLSWI